MCHKRVALTVAGIIFAVVAIVHILRMVYHWTVVVAGVIIPNTVSVVAIIISAVLAVWMFSAACAKK